MRLNDEHAGIVGFNLPPNSSEISPSLVDVTAPLGSS